MPYIEKERVSEIRKQLKKEFPQLKMSVTRKHYSVVDVTILEGPEFLAPKEGRMEQQINCFHIARDFKNNPEAVNILQRINDVADEGNGVFCEDGDYGTVPNFYVHITIGKWDKPYKVK